MHIDKRFAFLLMALMIILGAFVLSTETAFAQAPVVSVGTASGNAGTAVDLTVSFTAGATGVSTLQFDLTFPSSLAYVSTTTGAAATAAGKSASGSAISGGARVLVFALNTTSIGSGAVAIVRLNIASVTSPASIPVGITGIVASDSVSNAVTANGSGGSVTVTTPGDTTAPVISAVTASGMTATGATISWTTNEASDTQVEYGKTTAYGSLTTLNGSMVTSHSQGLSGLTASTTYNYRVRSKDAAGNQAVSGNATFATTAAADTTAPVISAVTASGMTATGATISWTTNEASDTQVEYGKTTAYGSLTTLNGSMVTSHSQGLSGLTASTTYNYRVRSKDAAGNQAVSGNATFATTAAADTTAPVISAVTSSGMSATGATISWTTNEASDTQVEYGTTTAYGSLTTLNGSMVTSHSQGLSGLTASTTYNYRVRSKDAAGNQAVSGNATFATTTAPDTTAPVISAVTSSGMTTTGATISWTTNEASDTQVEYGTTTAYGSTTTLNTSQLTSHLQSVSGLSARTLYHYRVKSKDAAGNLATSADLTFTTSSVLPPPTNVTVK